MSSNNKKPLNSKTKIDPKNQIDPQYAKLTTKQQKANYFLNTATQKVIHQLDQQKIKIPSQKVLILNKRQLQKPYINQHDKQELQKMKQEEMLKQLKKEQQEMKMKLSIINQKQKQYRSKLIKEKYKSQKLDLSQKSIINQSDSMDRNKNRLINKSKGNLDINMSTLQEPSQTSSKKRPNSQIRMNQQSIAMLKKWRHQQKQFQKRMKQRTHQYEQKIKRMEEQEHQLQQKKKKQINQAKRQALIKRIQELDLKRQQKTKQHQQQKKRILQVKMKKKLYQELQKKWNQKNQKDEQDKKRLYQQRMRNKSIEFSDLKEHSKKYQELIKQQKVKRLEKAAQMSRFVNNTVSDTEKSKYYTIVMKQQRKLRKYHLQKQKQPKLKKQKIDEYSSMVKEQFAPKIKSEQDDESHQNKSRNLSEKRVPRKTVEQIKEIGNKYLENSKAILSKKERRNDSLFQIHEINPPKKYKDYLQQTRAQKKQANGSSQSQGQRSNKFYNKNKAEDIFQKQIEEAKKIMQKEGCQKDKIDKVKLLTQRIQQQSAIRKIDKSNALIKKIAAKIQILEVIN